MIPAGQQRGTGRRAEGGRVEVCVAEAIRGHAVHRRRGDTAAEGAHLPVATVVDEHQQDVRSVFKSKRGGHLELRLDRLRILVGETYLPSERFFSTRKNLLSVNGASECGDKYEQ